MFSTLILNTSPETQKQINLLELEREEMKILIGRPSDIKIADPKYLERYTKHQRDVYTQLSRKRMNTTSFAKFANLPDIDAYNAGLYSEPNPFAEEFRQNVWWSQQDANLGQGYESGYTKTNNAGGLGTGFLALGYFPFFSNCKGSGQYMSISKVSNILLKGPVV